MRAPIATIVVALLCGCSQEHREAEDRVTNLTLVMQSLVTQGVLSSNIPATEIQQAISTSELGDKAKDPWGTDYLIMVTNGTAAVLSAGPDRTFGTRDDI